MLDWINSMAAEVNTTFRVVVSVAAGIIALILCHKGGWALTRIIISVLSVALLVVAVSNMDLFSNRIETDIRRGNPPVVQVSEPGTPV